MRTNLGGGKVVSRRMAGRPACAREQSLRRVPIGSSGCLLRSCRETTWMREIIWSALDVVTGGCSLTVIWIGGLRTLVGLFSIDRACIARFSSFGPAQYHSLLLLLLWVVIPLNEDSMDHVMSKHMEAALKQICNWILFLALCCS